MRQFQRGHDLSAPSTVMPAELVAVVKVVVILRRMASASARPWLECRSRRGKTTCVFLPPSRSAKSSSEKPSSCKQRWNECLATVGKFAANRFVTPSCRSRETVRCEAAYRHPVRTIPPTPSSLQR